ncbi:MAG: SDR family oxidoreductase [Cyanobacteria bacterium P01_D01_bin.105]
MPTETTFTPARRALITGASSGIGAACALAFARAGFDVALVARSAQKLSALASELSALGVNAKAFSIDLSDLGSVKQSIVEIETSFGPIDALINSAGVGYTSRLGDMPLADWQRVMDLNVTSVFQVIQAVLPSMRSRSQGTIINIASIAAQQAFENWGAYSISKAALVALSDAIRVEEAANGIRVVTISPGAVNTPIWDTDTVHSAFDRAAMLDAQTVAQTILYAALLPSNAVISALTLTPTGGAL